MNMILRYYGHGVQVNNQNYLLPTKKIFNNVDDNGVSVQKIMRYLEGKTNHVNVLILYACRDNPFESDWSTTRSIKGGGLAKMSAPSGSLIAFSTDAVRQLQMEMVRIVYTPSVFLKICV